VPEIAGELMMSSSRRVGGVVFAFKGCRCKNIPTIETMRRAAQQYPLRSMKVACAGMSHPCNENSSSERWRIVRGFCAETVVAILLSLDDNS